MSQRQDVVTVTFPLCQERAEKIGNKQNALIRKWSATAIPQQKTPHWNGAHWRNAWLSALPQQHRGLKARRRRDLFYSLVARSHPARPAHRFSFLHRWPPRERPGWKRAARRTARPLALWAEQGKGAWEAEPAACGQVSSPFALQVINEMYTFLTLPSKSWKKNYCGKSLVLREKKEKTNMLSWD